MKEDYGQYGCGNPAPALDRAALPESVQAYRLTLADFSPNLGILASSPASKVPNEE
jgi:hypothetical protein